MKYKIKGLAAMIVACAVALCSGIAAAQSYPTKPVRLIIPFPPGGRYDIVGRFIILIVMAAPAVRKWWGAAGASSREGTA